jgi:hypothetical protein
MYQALVEGFRSAPGDFVKAAKLAGVDRRTALRGWELGWPQKDFEPIRTVFEREQVKARAAIVAQQAARRAAHLKEREDAIANAARAREQEGSIVAAARGAAGRLLTDLVKLAPAVGKLAEQLGETLRREAEAAARDPQNHAVAAGRGMNLVSQFVTLEQRVITLAHEAMQMERLHLGQPNATVNVITSQTEMTMEEAEVRIEMAARALEGARRSGGLSVIDGGLKQPVVGRTVTGAALDETPSDGNGASSKANVG